MSEREITHVDTDSAALLFAIFGGVNGIIAMILAIIFLPSSGGFNLLLFFIISAVVGAISGSVVGIITAELYNLFTNWTGGVVVTIGNTNPDHTEWK